MERISIDDCDNRFLAEVGNYYLGFQGILQQVTLDLGCLKDQLLEKMLFCENPFLKFEWVKFGADFPRPNPFTRFVRSKLHIENGELLTSPVGMDESNIVMSLVKN